MSVVLSRLRNRRARVIFSTACVNVYEVKTDEYEVLYEVEVDSTCWREPCPSFTSALDAVGPWAHEALPLSELHDDCHSTFLITPP